MRGFEGYGQGFKRFLASQIGGKSPGDFLSRGDIVMPSLSVPILVLLLEIIYYVLINEL